MSSSHLAEGTGLILDPGTLCQISYPYDNNSINRNIPKENSTIYYVSLNDAIKIIQRLGPKSNMAKSDIKGAFWIVPLHPSQYNLMGFKWRGLYYYGRCLAMGLSSSCKVFFRVAIHSQEEI